MTPNTNSNEPALPTEPAPAAPPEFDPEPLTARLSDLTRRVTYFPVRHHSPACAAAVGELIRTLRPAAVLIEGPSDFNPYFDELLLDHDLPIAIYGWRRDAAGRHRGAFHPFCEYSPEWVALRQGIAAGATVRFIDLPWSLLPDDDRLPQRYADAELRRGRYARELCDRLGADGFDELWDLLIESRLDLPAAELVAVVHALCCRIRLWEREISTSDRRREAFMAERIRAATCEFSGPILVVTGGFHSAALVARLEGLPCSGCDDSEDAVSPTSDAAALDASAPVAAEEISSSPAAPLSEGIALTAYSYERLDGLKGYEAGMPSPGFYDRVWRQRAAGEAYSHRPMLVELVQELRRRKQTASTADLIAVETAARALACLRGRPHVWRADLLDAVMSALVKDEVEYGGTSPFVEAVRSVLRGTRRGRIAAGTRRPPLVTAIHNELARLGLDQNRARDVIEVDLLRPEERETSRFFHRLRILGVVGFERTKGPDFAARTDLTRLVETWRRTWSPEFEASCVEASRFGADPAEAVAACLLERAGDLDRGAAPAAEMLLEAAHAGVEALAPDLLNRLTSLIDREGDFVGATTALGHLIHLHFHDEAFGTTDLPRIGALLASCWGRSLWLLESLGRGGGNEREQLAGVQALLEGFERGSVRLGLDRGEFVAVLERVAAGEGKSPQLRGAAAGALWTLGLATPERIAAELRLFADPTQLGDFLTGLFALAREAAQRHPVLVRAIDALLISYPAEELLHALPALRLAFTYFTPREKHTLLRTLFDSLGLRGEAPLDRLTTDVSTAAAALVVEEYIFAAVVKYGLHGDEPDGPHGGES